MSKLQPAGKINLGSSMMIRARLSEEEYKRLRILALERNQSTPELIGELVRGELERSKP